MDCVIVSHTHWDREWYRTFQAFRARLVDTIDRVLELIDSDPDYHFHLDGQSVILEDYLEIRPAGRESLERAARAGRLSLGPWYVQPDSLMPSGEAHVRNLQEGRRVAAQFGPVSTVAYTPDSFGHPAQFPQLFDGFGMNAFVYARGGGLETEELPAEYRWVAPDGSAILACHLVKGYSNAAGLSTDVDRAAERLEAVIDVLGRATRSDRVLLMNGTDHMLPDAHVGRVAEALAERIDGKVVRGLIEDLVEGVNPDLPEWRGELLGAGSSNLLPGVWSTRTYLKLRNRACEAALEGWAEPWAALHAVVGGPDERPALRLAWRSLLQNQAHDSLCGCSQDRVHEQMLARYDAAEEIADETASRALDRLCGAGLERNNPWSDDVEVAVFNPSPHVRTDVVNVPIDAFPPWHVDERLHVHPLVRSNLDPKGFSVDGEPARLVVDERNRRVRLSPDQSDWNVQFVAPDVPPFGYRTFKLTRSGSAPETIDAGTSIGAGDVVVEAGPDGTLAVTFGERRFDGVLGVEDLGDRGDTYDFEPVAGEWGLERVETERRRHPNGIQELRTVRRLRLPAGLGEDRMARSAELAVVTLTSVARVAPGVGRVDLEVTVDNEARDHRLRLLFPTGGPCQRFAAATTFDTVLRSTALPDDSAWVHPATPTFPSQGWVSANGLVVVAPGLYEAEVSAGGIVAITLLRATGWLSRPDLASRPGPAGPSLATPGAQCLGRTTARLALTIDEDPAAPRDFELGLRSAIVSGEPPLAPGASLLSLEPRGLLLSAVLPAEDGVGVVVRVCNPADAAVEASLSVGFPALEAELVALDGSVLERLPLREPLVFEVPGRALRTVLLRATRVRTPEASGTAKD